MTRKEYEAKYGVAPAKPTAIRMTREEYNAKYGEKPQETYGALFPASKSDTPLTAGLKAAGNLPTSAFQFGKGLFQAALHPIQTGKALFNTAVGGVETGLEKITGIETESDTQEQFAMLASVLKERYGSLENLQRTATNDPFGFGADILGVVEGGASLAGKTGVATRALTDVASKGIIEPVTTVAKGASGVAGKTARFGVSQATGLNPETISAVIDDPATFSKTALKTANREDLASSVKTVIDKRLNDLKETGKGYESIRTTEATVKVPPQTVQSVLDKYGIKVVDGKIKTTAETVPLSASDKTALSDFLNVYGNEAQLSSNAFLNTRSALSELARYEATRTGNLQKISRDLRAVYDDLGKQQIPGLKELDEAYAPEVKILNQIKKDYLKPDGTFKDGAITKLANLTGKGKEQTLARLEQIMPGVTQRVQILKAAEDIERAAGIKVGTYGRAVVSGAGLMTGNIPLIVGAIISSPEIAVRLLRAYGFTKKTVAPVVQLLRGAANDVNNFRLPGRASQYIQSYIENPKVGMSIEDVTKNNPLLAEARTKGEYVPFESSGTYKKIMSRDGDAFKAGFATGDEGFGFGGAISAEEKAAALARSKKLIQDLRKQDPLLTEARKYKSAEEFVKAHTQTHLMDLSNYEQHRWGRALDEFTLKESVANFVTGKSELGSLDSLKYDNPAVYKAVTSPGDKITVYRAVPKTAPDGVQVGDYVALERRYADMHQRSILEGEQKTAGKVIEMEVPKTDVIWMGNDYNEWVYSPQKLRDQYPNGLTDIWKKAHATK